MSGDKLIRGAFYLSLTMHLLFLNMPAFKLNFFNDFEEKEEELFVQIQIEEPLLLPKLEVMGEEMKIEEIIEEPKPELQPEEVVLEKPEPPKEFVEVINPQDEAMLRYQDTVKQRIEEARRYPYRAKKQGIEGEVGLKFSVLSNGFAQKIRIIHSSGFQMLDEEAIATIKRADPFPFIPGNIKATQVQMKVTIVFKIEY